MKDKIQERLINFATEIINLFLNKEHSHLINNIAWQVIDSASSSGANYAEATSAESRADFIHKLQIVLKELKETLYWLKLIKKLKILKKNIDYLINENIELIKIISQSVITAKSNR
ncbi:four helix bundle protein [Candidatus Margulisiibacteriota bacterium]